MARVLGFLIGLGVIAHYVVIGIGGGGTDGLGAQYSIAVTDFLTDTVGLGDGIVSRIFYGGPGVLAGAFCMLLACRSNRSD